MRSAARHRMPREAPPAAEGGAKRRPPRGRREAPSAPRTARSAVRPVRRCAPADMQSKNLKKHEMSKRGATKQEADRVRVCEARSKFLEASGTVFLIF